MNKLNLRFNQYRVLYNFKPMELIKKIGIPYYAYTCLRDGKALRGVHREKIIDFLGLDEYLDWKPGKIKNDVEKYLGESNEERT